MFYTKGHIFHYIQLLLYQGWWRDACRTIQTSRRYMKTTIKVVLWLQMWETLVEGIDGHHRGLFLGDDGLDVMVPKAQRKIVCLVLVNRLRRVGMKQHLQRPHMCHFFKNLSIETVKQLPTKHRLMCVSHMSKHATSWSLWPGTPQMQNTWVPCSFSRLIHHRAVVDR